MVVSGFDCDSGNKNLDSGSDPRIPTYEGSVKYLMGISVFNSAFADNRTQAALTFQAQIAMAPLGWHRGSFWPFC